jgi:hypothetical protein
MFPQQSSVKNKKATVALFGKSAYLPFMKIAYGYNRATDAFDAYAPDRVHVDTPETRRAERQSLFKKAGLREKDTLILFGWGDLAQGGEIPIFRERLAEMGVTVEIVEMPKAEAKRRGRSPWAALRALSAEDDATLRAMWEDPIIYTQAHCLQWATDRVGRAITRNQLNRRYGNRSK